jgi:hypothetical protein
MLAFSFLSSATWNSLITGCFMPQYDASPHHQRFTWLSVGEQIPYNSPPPPSPTFHPSQCSSTPVEV